MSDLDLTGKTFEEKVLVHLADIRNRLNTLDDHHELLYGNGKPGLKDTVANHARFIDEANTRSRQFRTTIWWVGGSLFVAFVLWLITVVPKLNALP